MGLKSLKHDALHALTRALLYASYLVVVQATLSPMLFSQQSEEMRFRRLSAKEGLSQLVVTAIVCDRQGYMWFATQDGLNRYDGYSIKVYRHDLADSTSIPDNNIWRLLTRRNGELWAATFKGGLSRFNPAEDNFRSFQHDATDPASISSDNVTALGEDSYGSLWVGTWFGGLNRLDSTGSGRTDFIHYRHTPGDPYSLADDRVGAILEDSFGDLWVGTWNGLSRLRRDDRERARFTNYAHDPEDPHSLSSNMIWSMCEDRSGDVWIATWGGGLSRYVRASGSFTSYRHDPHRSSSLGGDLLRCVYLDGRGTVWAGTYDAGLDRFDPARGVFHHFLKDPDDPQSLPENEVQSIFEDRTGTLWIGTSGGVASYSRQREKFQIYKHRAGVAGSLTHHRVRSLATDGTGGLWIGTFGGGLVHLPSGSDRFVRYQHRPDDPTSVGSDIITCITEQSNGDIWVGTRGGGLDRFDRRTGRFTHFKNSPDDPRSISLDDIASLCETSDGQLWIGTNGGGLDRFDRQAGQFVHYRHDSADSNSLSGNSVWSLFEDSRGNLWVGTWGADLNRFDRARNRFVRYRHRPADPLTLSDNTVVCMAGDRQGNVWIGTTDGLSKYDYATDRFTRYSERGGLPNNSINGLLVDRNDHLWMSTNKGLSRFDPRTGGFKNFSVADGLQVDEFDQGAFAQGPSGRLYFAGAGGITAFDPDSIRGNPFVPPVVITSFKVFEKPVALGQADAYHVTLSYDESFFSFEYAALDFTAPEKNQYLYKLEGYDENWITAGTRRYASYTHLDAGEYVFRVKGSNNDGVWNEEGVGVFITIMPPYWETWWFRTMLIAVTVGIMYAIYRYRVNKLLAIELTRNRIARDLHDDMAATLGGIAYFAQAIRDETMNNVTSSSERFLSLIQESTAELQESMSDIIWSINPENDDWERVLAKFRRYASDLFDSKNIKYKIDIPDTTRLRPLGMEQRRNFWLIYREMVTNVVRHSECSEASVEITVINSRVLRMRISDNGKGFDPSAPTGRNGNRNIRSRSDELHAQLALTTAPGAGTTWELVFAP